MYSNVISQVDQSTFDEQKVLYDLKHYLPAQAPLKDFVHHNTLHAFQDLKFHDALHKASEIFGYKVYLSLDKFRELYQNHKIREDILDQVIRNKKGSDQLSLWKEKLISQRYDTSIHSRIGKLRNHWRSEFNVDIDAITHPVLFRIICSYLDQGISIWRFPANPRGFLASIRDLEKNSLMSFFKTRQVRELLFHSHLSLQTLLKMLVGGEALFRTYLFDQQFAHQGWSGMVSVIEDHPESLLDKRRISLHDVIIFELLLELDALYHVLDDCWEPLANRLKQKNNDLFEHIPHREIYDVYALWQEAFEWNYYDQVLKGIQLGQLPDDKELGNMDFQAMFCIDDRECSLRRYLENLNPHSETFSTPGFFNVEFYYQSEHSKFYTKLCPVSVTPRHLIKEVNSRFRRGKEHLFSKNSHGMFGGWLLTPVLGFWSALKLFLNIFRPSLSPSAAFAFQHMDKHSWLTIENKNPSDREKNLQIGFTITEMTDRVEGLLKSTGLVNNFAPVVYLVGHGASSVNNPHYSAYDCGACCGRPGSVNARVMSYMANHPKVREELIFRDIKIPLDTQFLGAIHDTTRDDILFFDEESLFPFNREIHGRNLNLFREALDLNAKERARRFESIDLELSVEKIHRKIRQRSVSIFEPRPELNHATNALCIIGRRSLSHHLFLDRRSFMNSYNYQIDPDGKYLLNILKAAASVCGGINLEYYFSRVDNHKLGAGTKLPHNVMGLFGVANGSDGDLRPGLPSQMIEIHDPMRLMIIIEHFPECILDVIKQSMHTYKWFINEWIHLVAVHPETRAVYSFNNGDFRLYTPLQKHLETIADLASLLRYSHEDLPIYLIS